VSTTGGEDVPSEPDQLEAALEAKGVESFCPACREDMGFAGTLKIRLGTSGAGMHDFIGGYCAACGFLRLFHEATLEAANS
jgi:hypothetical protein